MAVDYLFVVGKTSVNGSLYTHSTHRYTLTGFVKEYILFC